MADLQTSKGKVSVTQSEDSDQVEIAFEKVVRRGGNITRSRKSLIITEEEAQALLHALMDELG